MSGKLLLYAGSIVLFGWGAAHIMPVKSVVRGFGEISRDNRHIITMTWVSEGLFLCFIGFLVFAMAARFNISDPCLKTVVVISAAMLILGAVWTALTGARARVVPMRLCPIVKTIVAVCYIVGLLM